jgi:hypothetical protein
VIQSEEDDGEEEGEFEDDLLVDNYYEEDE